MSCAETKKKSQAGGRKALVPLLLSGALSSLNNSSCPLDLIRKRHLGWKPELDSKAEEEEGRKRLVLRLLS